MQRAIKTPPASTLPCSRDAASRLIGGRCGDSAGRARSQPSTGRDGDADDGHADAETDALSHSEPDTFTHALSHSETDALADDGHPDDGQADDGHADVVTDALSHSEPDTFTHALSHCEPDTFTHAQANDSFTHAQSHDAYFRAFGGADDGPNVDADSSWHGRCAMLLELEPSLQ